MPDQPETTLYCPHGPGCCVVLAPADEEPL